MQSMMRCRERSGQRISLSFGLEKISCCLFFGPLCASTGLMPRCTVPHESRTSHDNETEWLIETKWLIGCLVYVYWMIDSIFAWLMGMMSSIGDLPSRVPILAQMSRVISTATSAKNLKKSNTNWRFHISICIFHMELIQENPPTKTTNTAPAKDLELGTLTCSLAACLKVHASKAFENVSTYSIWNNNLTIYYV